MSDNLDIPYKKKAPIAQRLVVNTSNYVRHPDLEPYYNLWTAVIRQAVGHAKDSGSVGFFKSKWFVQICDMIDLDHMKVIYSLPKHLQDKVLKK